MSAVASLSAGASPVQRVPWLWYELVVSRTNAPFWMPSAVLLVLLWSGGIAIASAGGQLQEAIGDPRFWLLQAYPAFCSLALGYAPEALHKLSANLVPWLDRSDDYALPALRSALSQDLTRFFQVGWLISAALVIWFGLIDPADLNLAIHRETHQRLQLFDLPFYVYFVGSVTPFPTWGLWLVIKRLCSLKLKRDFLLKGAKQALRPFNELLVVVWMTCVLPMSLIVLVALVKGVSDVGAAVYSVVFLGLSVVIVFLPQLLMNDWLRQLQTEHLQSLRRQVDETATVGEAGDLVAVERALLRHQHLLYQIDQVRTSSVTLIDMKFIFQIATSMTAILIANIVLRAFLR